VIATSARRRAIEPGSVRRMLALAVMRPAGMQAT
jgi:hypothetical protein